MLLLVECFEAHPVEGTPIPHAFSAAFLTVVFPHFTQSTAPLKDNSDERVIRGKLGYGFFTVIAGGITCFGHALDIIRHAIDPKNVSLNACDQTVLLHLRVVI